MRQCSHCGQATIRTDTGGCVFCARPQDPPIVGTKPDWTLGAANGPTFEFAKREDILPRLDAQIAAYERRERSKRP